MRMSKMLFQLQSAAFLALSVALLSGPAVAQISDPVPSPDPVPVDVHVYGDDFSSGTTYASYTPLGAAVVAISGGQLHVQVPPGASNSGLRVRLPKDGTGVRCIGFEGMNVPSSSPGSFLRWVVYGYDDFTRQEIVLLDTTIQEGSLTVTTRAGAGPAKNQDGIKILHKKSDGRTVSHFIPGKKASDIKKKMWDTRRSGTQVQLEITWNDGTKYNSNWIDPPASTFAGFDVLTNLAELSVDGSGGDEIHVEATAEKPTVVDSFEPSSLNLLEPHWLLQAWDAEAVVVATVSRISRPAAPLSGDPRPRMLVRYSLGEVIAGSLPQSSFIVSHVLEGTADRARFAPGEKMILFLQRTDPPAQTGRKAWYFDYGRPAGVISYSEQNLRAVTTRLQLIHGGQEE